MRTPRFALSALTAVTFAVPAAAQGSCEIDTRKPVQLAGAMAAIARHDALADRDERLKLTRQLVRGLTTNPERLRNEVGRNYVLGQVYVRWFKNAAPRIVLRATRADLGFAEDPDGAFYLPTALDEVMGVVERERPACADSTSRYRNAVFIDVLNAAINFNNAKSYDSAIVYANHALRVAPRSPLVNNAQQVLANASKATFNLAVLARDQAMKESGETRNAGLRRAAALFKSYLELAPNGDNASTARAASARSLLDAGDTASVSGIYADMLANPLKYTAIQLFEAAVVQANGQKFADAAVLYESGLRENPWYRDALFNVANVYLALHQPEKMAHVVARLQAADPMNPDVVRLAGAVWQERAAQSADAKVRQVSQDSVLAHLDRASRLPARVTVSRFLVARDSLLTLAGAVENLGTSIANFTVSFDLLDKSGATVGTAEVTAEQVAARGRHEFSAQVGVAGVVAWRYRMQ